MARLPRPVSLVLPLLAAAAFVSPARAADAVSGWPWHRGPFGNGTAVDCGEELIEDLAKARVVWKSEEKTPCAYPINMKAGHAFIQGGYAAPVVADGRVYLFYWVPSGSVCDEAYVAKGMADAKAKPLGEEVMRRKYAIAADDVVLCADAETGKTLWKSVQKEKGLSSSKQGRGVCISVKGTPRLDVCVAAGKVFAIGTTGRIYALDAKSGDLVWESKLPQANAALEAAKAALLKVKDAEGGRRVNLSVCPMYADGVLVVGDEGGLLGLDPASGKTVWGPVAGWQHAGGSCPLRWAHQGREYILAETTCIEPRTGKVLWKVDGAVHSDESGCVALSGDRLICCGGGRKGVMGLQCYRITPEGATKVWALGPEYAAKQFCSPVIYKGYVYTRAGGGNDKTGMACVDLETGKVLGSAKCPGSCNEVVATDGRLFYEGSYQGPAMYKTDPKDFRLLGEGVLKDLDFACSVPPAIVGGRMYYRSNTFGIMCLDLRKGKQDDAAAAKK